MVEQKVIQNRHLMVYIYDTLSKKCKTEDFGDYVLNDSKVASYVVNKSSKVDVKKYEISDANILGTLLRITM